MKDLKTSHQKPKEYDYINFITALLVTVSIWLASFILFHLIFDLIWVFFGIFVISLWIFLRGIVITPPMYSYVPESWRKGFVPDAKTMPGITFLFWPFEDVSLRGLVFTGKRTLLIKRFIFSKTSGEASSATAEKNLLGGVELALSGIIIVQSVNPYKVVTYAGGIKDIDEYLIELVENPARKIGKENSWDKILYGVFETLDNAKAEEVIETGIINILRTIPGYTENDSVIGNVGQEVKSINISNIDLPDNFKKKLQKIEDEKLERISEIQDAKTLFESAKEAIGESGDKSVNLKEALNQIQARTGKMNRVENINTTNASKEVLDVVKEVGKSLSDAIIGGMNKWFESKKSGT